MEAARMGQITDDDKLTFVGVRHFAGAGRGRTMTLPTAFVDAAFRTRL